MSTVTLSDTTFEWLEQRARQTAQNPDMLADQLLRERLAPQHAYVEVIDKEAGSQAVIKGTRIPVSIIVGYLRVGETPESLTKEILPHLTLAQVYDALSYYYDHREKIDQEINENSEEHGRAILRGRLTEAGYRQVTGQSK